MADVIGFASKLEPVKEITCLACQAIIEYTFYDIKTRRNSRQTRVYTFETDYVVWITCPNCNRNVTVHEQTTVGYDESYKGAMHGNGNR